MTSGPVIFRCASVAADAGVVDEASKPTASDAAATPTSRTRVRRVRRTDLHKIMLMGGPNRGRQSCREGGANSDAPIARSVPLPVTAPFPSTPLTDLSPPSFERSEGEKDRLGDPPSEPVTEPRSAQAPTSAVRSRSRRPSHRGRRRPTLGGSSSGSDATQPACSHVVAARGEDGPLGRDQSGVER